MGNILMSNISKTVTNTTRINGSRI